MELDLNKIINLLTYYGLEQAPLDLYKQAVIYVSDIGILSNQDLILPNNTIPSFQDGPPIPSFPVRGPNIHCTHIQRLSFSEPSIDAPDILIPGTTLYLNSIPTLTFENLLKTNNYSEQLAIMLSEDFKALLRLMRRDGLDESVFGIVTHSRMLSFLTKKYPKMQFDNQRIFRKPLTGYYRDIIEESILRQLTIVGKTYPREKIQPEIILIKGADFAEMINN